MGELVDTDLLLGATQELARAQEYARSQVRGEKARRARLVAVRGSVAARKDLAARWAAVDPKTVDRDILARTTVAYSGEGPPVDTPANIPVGAYYLNELTKTLYRLGAQ